MTEGADFQSRSGNSADACVDVTVHTFAQELSAGIASTSRKVSPTKKARGPGLSSHHGLPAGTQNNFRLPCILPCVSGAGQLSEPANCAGGGQDFERGMNPTFFTISAAAASVVAHLMKASPSGLSLSLMV